MLPSVVRLIISFFHESRRSRVAHVTNRLKAPYHSFPKKKIKILKSVKLKEQDVSSEVLVTAIEVKCNFMAITGKC